MKVLIYLGYQQKNLEYQDFIEGNSIGGTEITALKLAEELAKSGYETFLGGQIRPGFHNGVEWLDLNGCSSKHFDVVIAASYLHFVDTIDAKFKYFWLHNTDYYKWFNGEEKYDEDRLNDDTINGIIVLTEWHKKVIQEKYNIEKPIYVIGNAIDRKTFGPEKSKIKDSFIYSSAGERGLSKLLAMWPKILAEIPTATLNIFTPGYDSMRFSIWLDNVVQHGTVDQKTLHDWQQKSEYWLHPTEYDETYCITAVEMQYAKVIPITTNRSALTEIVSNRGILFDNIETPEQYINIIKDLRNSSRKEVLKDKAHNWAKQQSWNVRILDWIKLLKQHEN